MSKKIKIIDDSMVISRGWGRIENGKGYWDTGIVVTPHGIVFIYAQDNKAYDDFTRIDFAFEGRYYMRNFHGKRYSSRGIVTKAKQFAKEISTA